MDDNFRKHDKFAAYRRYSIGTACFNLLFGSLLTHSFYTFSFENPDKSECFAHESTTVP